ncbi:odorant receptor 131-2-like [Rana temporaria]|uniref:odorant receptor 131-2-like n=1 Tax=Rana temporaria TaxID=8407 RepID=UPI001AADEC35|nr:odorant receptor 131-2-like [Rana temporaria]
MMNLTVFSTFNNITYISSQYYQLYQNAKLVFFAFIIFCFCFFIYFILVLLVVYFTTPHVRENARYILFAHMLINDTLYLSLGLFLCLGFGFLLYIPVPICYVLVNFAAATFRITPYNLAIMALERYVAICFPLKHIMLCTARRSYFAIAAMWFVGWLPNVADFIILISSVEVKFFSRNLLCRHQSLLVLPAQNTIQFSTLIGSLILVSLVILFTYIKVMLIARKTGSGKSSASKAGRTLILHGVQLFLCLLSLTSSFSELYQGDFYYFVILINFLMFMCVPRLLSPLIYGIRDSVFSKSIKKMKMYSTN